MSAEKLTALHFLVQAGDRVCPRPMDWQRFWESLPGATRTEVGFVPAAPIVLSGWWHSTNEAKAERLREQIVWAASHGGLDVADAFLRGLAIDAWHHSIHTKPNY